MLALALLVQSYHWLEAERFEGVAGHYQSWQAEKAEPGWHWNGPGVSAEWGQGGESGFNSIACVGKASARQRVQIEHAGRWRLWIRHSEAREPQAIGVSIGGRKFRVGEKATLDPQDEALSYWGWTFVWESIDVDLPAGATTIELDCAGNARRIVDVLVLTDDLKWQARGRERPHFAYIDALEAWRQGAAQVPPAARLDPDPKWAPPPLVVPWNFNADSFVDGLPPFAVEPQIRKAFLAQFGKGPLPIFSSKLIAPVFTLDQLPALLAAGAPARKFLESTKRAFFVLVNYQQAPWRKQDATRKGVVDAQRALAYRGDISGESIGYPWDTPAPKLDGTRADVLASLRSVYDAALTKKARDLDREGSPWPPLIAALSSGSSAFAHALAAWGCKRIGLETAVGMPNFAARIAFVRGAARQYGRQFLYYHAPNFGDTATTFTHTQNFLGPNAWFHTRYGLVFGPSIAWYRKALHQEWFAGAEEIYLEQGADQFFQPGPGAHPVELNPIGRVTDAFLRYVEGRERGTPVAPVALLLDRAHGWDDSAYVPRAFNLEGDAKAIVPSRADDEIAQTLDVLYYPNALAQGEPATAERQAFVHALLGDGVDVLVADEGAPIDRYRVVIAVGVQNVPPALAKALAEYKGTLLIARGGALDQLCGRATCKDALAPDGSANPEWAQAIAQAAWASAPVHVIGDIEWAVNRNRKGYQVLLMNSRGNDKPQQGLAIAPHRDQFADVEIQTRGTKLDVRVPAGAMRIIDVPISARE